MASSHRPIAWMSRKATSVKSPNPHLRSRSASATNTAVTTNAWGAVRTTSTASSRNSITAEMKLNKGPKFAVSQSTNAPTGAPTSISGIAVVLPRGGQRREQRRARDDAEQFPGGIGDSERNAVAADQRADVAQARVRRRP